MLLANIFVVAGLYLLSSWLFTLSFRQYLDASQERELAPLVAALAERFAIESNWSWIESPQDPDWQSLIETYVIKNRGSRSNQPPKDDKFHPPKERLLDRRRDTGRDRPPKRMQDGQRDGPPFKRPPPPRPEHLAPPGQFGINPSILLADSEKRLIVGRKDKRHAVNWIDIQVEQRIVGYIGYFRTQDITSELDRVFIERLRENISWSLLLIIFVSALITLLLASRFVRPIQRIRLATKAIIAGKYSTQIKIESLDEIGELSKDFNQLANSLKQNLTARQRWIADISHELRTPVAILQGELEAMQDGVRSVNKASIESLHQEVVRLSKLISDLHELSLSDSGALSYQFERCDLVELIQEVFELMRASINQCQFTVTHQPAASTIYLSGDQYRLTQLFMNLLNNSLSYSYKGGEVRVDYKFENGGVTVFWLDSEPGCSDSQLEKLFERLYRVESSRNRNLGGSGLGLSICKNIVIAHGGTIEARHANLGGVEFRIHFPITD